jgi:hypothetical protein
MGLLSQFQAQRDKIIPPFDESVSKALIYGYGEV